MHAIRTARVVIAAVALLSSCGDDDDTTAGGDTTAAAESTTTIVAAESTTTAAVESTTTAAAESTTTTEVAGIEQPAIWPAADVVFASPEAAAEDFVTKVLGVPPLLGGFEQGDARSGEMDVLSPGEGAGAPVARGRLALRQLGPDDGWFIVAAVNDNASISAPVPMAEVAAGPLTVEGAARGLEANVVVTAFVAGDADHELDQVITQGGAFETPEPFTVSLDLSDASPGDIVTLLVTGGAGLETDPGEFGAIPVVIAG